MTSANAIRTHLIAEHTVLEGVLLGSYDCHVNKDGLRYVCQICCTVYNSLSDLQTHMNHNPAPHPGRCDAACHLNELDNYFEHYYDYHYDDWVASHRAITGNVHYIDIGNPIDTLAGQHANGLPVDVIVQRWTSTLAPEIEARIKTCFTPFLCHPCNFVSATRLL